MEISFIGVYLSSEEKKIVMFCSVTINDNTKRGKTCNQRQARENMEATLSAGKTCVSQGVIGFGLDSNWLKKGIWSLIGSSKAHEIWFSKATF